jgi:hypothetical protein
LFLLLPLLLFFAVVLSLVILSAAKNLRLLVFVSSG